MKVNAFEVLLSIFIVKVLIVPPTMVEAVCLTALLVHHFASKFVKAKNISDELLNEIKEHKDKTNKEIEEIKDVTSKAIQSMEGVKTAINFMSGKKLG
jgi:hypothetical protein